MVGLFCFDGVWNMDYISIAQAAEKWGITRRRVQVLCSQGRIPGLTKFGKSWAIPKDAEKPMDARKKCIQIQEKKWLGVLFIGPQICYTEPIIGVAYIL